MCPDRPETPTILDGVDHKREEKEKEKKGKKKAFGGLFNKKGGGGASPSKDVPQAIGKQM